MQKKNAIILTLAIVAILIIGSLWFYFSGGNQSQAPVTTDGTTSLPFGNTPGNKTTADNTGTGNNTITPSQQTAGEVPQLRQIYSSPVSGATIFIKDGIIKIRFVDRSTGNIQEAKTDSKEVLRITNTTIPKIQESVWGINGSNLIMRYLDENTNAISSFSGKIKISSSSSNEFLGEMIGGFLSPNADSVVINPAGDKAFALIKKTDGNGSYGVISSIDGMNKKQAFDSQISSWIISWPKNSIIPFTTKPTFKNAGYTFFLNTDTNSFDRILGNKYGLTVLVRKDATSMIYSESLRGSIRLSHYDIRNNNDKSLQVSTFSDKCVWSNTDNNIIYCAVPKNIPTGSYPDSWYQGITSFSDNIWKIDVEKGTTNMLYEIGRSDSAEIDTVDLKLSPDDKYLVFTNKNDLSLWGLRI
ncbi:MAG: hypothetical protein WC631_02865 [Candidatus Paceibacterota bacterium]|jgi:hypothetical protein